MTTPRPSSIRVFAKSLHLIAAGWLLGVLWLWLSQIQQNVIRFGVPPEGYAMNTLLEGIFPAALLELAALYVVDFIRKAPPGTEQRWREWHHAFWWALVPNLLIFATAYLLIYEGRA